MGDFKGGGHVLEASKSLPCSRRESQTAVPSPNVGWRGHGGGVPTLSSLQFDKQLDSISIWLDHWTHKERCELLEGLLHHCRLSQLQLLWTALQPSLHRDFMYTAKKLFPDLHFTPISSPFSRDHKRRMDLRRSQNYHRIDSAHVQHYDQVAGVMEGFKLPRLKKSAPQFSLPEPSCTSVDLMSSSKAPSWASNPVHHTVQSDGSYPRLRRRKKKQSSPFKSSLAGSKAGMHADVNTPAFTSISHRESCVTNAGSPSVRFSVMPVRRHMQQPEGTPSTRKSWSHPNGHMADTTGDSFESISTIGLSSTCPSDVPSDLLNKAHDAVRWFCDQWNDLQRNEFLHKILLRLDPRQHFFISSFLALRVSRDFLSFLPDWISLKILSYLRPLDIVRVSRVCKSWYYLCNNNELWKTKCKELKLDKRKLPEQPEWKTVFRESHHMKHNWRAGKCKTMNIKGHKDKVLAIACDDERLVTGSADSTIRVWGLHDGRCQCVMKGHLRGVWSLCFFATNLLISGSYDSTMKIWNLRDSTCMRTLIGHEGAVWAMALKDNVLVSVSQDKSAKVWDIGRCLLRHTLKGHTAAIFTVDICDDNLVATGSADRSIRLWSLVTGLQQRVIWGGQESSVMSVSYSGGHLACSMGNCVNVYRLVFKRRKEDATEILAGCKLVKSYEEHEKRIESVALNMEVGSKTRGILISAGKDGLIKQYDLIGSTSVQTYSGHTQTINCVHCDRRRIISASHDFRVKIWDFGAG